MIKLIQGDCLELLKTLPDASVDMVLTDPPYQILSYKWDKALDNNVMWAELKRVCKPNTAILLFGIEPFSSGLRTSNAKHYKYDWYWKKTQVGGFANVKKRPLKVLENIMVFAFGKAPYFPQGLVWLGKKRIERGRLALQNKRGEGAMYACNKKAGEYTQGFTNYPKHILQFENSNAKERGLHPTQKPVALLEYLIKTYTTENNTVLDFTMGSGSTGIACLNTGRKFIGMELDNHYFNVAQKRIEAHRQKLQETPPE